MESKPKEPSPLKLDRVYNWYPDSDDNIVIVKVMCVVVLVVVFSVWSHSCGFDAGARAVAGKDYVVVPLPDGTDTVVRSKPLPPHR